jgi:hypothetical protein
VENATAMIRKLLAVGERRFREFGASALMPQVATGAIYISTREPDTLPRI